jgi:tRNA(Ile2) C34 agmatinyltransferase TiaS
MPLEEQMIGGAWLAAAAELEDELRRHDPAARVRAGIDASGLARFEVSIEQRHRALARAACRRYEARANQICERCGGKAASVAAGAVVSVRCPDCGDELPRASG